MADVGETHDTNPCIALFSFFPCSSSFSVDNLDLFFFYYSARNSSRVPFAKHSVPRSTTHPAEQRSASRNDTTPTKRRHGPMFHRFTKRFPSNHFGLRLADKPQRMKQQVALTGVAVW